MAYRKANLAWALTGLLLLGFMATSVIGYFVAHDAVRTRIADQTLPLTSDNIYAEIERDLLRSILISSLMAHDTFVRDWMLEGERDEQAIIDYLSEIQNKYDTTTTFFVSERTRKYYHPDGVLATVDPDDEDDQWYFRVRDMDAPYEVNVDADTADPDRLTIFINYKVRDYEGGFIGATGVGLAVDSVSKLIESYERRYGRDIFFTDREGRITLHGDDREGDTLQQMPGMASLASRLLSSPSASARYTDADGRTVYVNSRLIPEFDWYLIVEQTKSQAEVRILNTLLLNIAVAVGITALVVITGWLTVRGYHLQLERLATTDSLSGAVNRPMFEHLFAQITGTARRHGTRTSALAVDIDDLKPLNDKHGHAAGDAAIKAISDVLRSNVRESDVVCRWGGDEFLVLLADCPIDQAAGKAEVLRETVEARPVQHGNERLSLAVTIGVTEYRDGEALDVLVERADAALYDAKQAGRNRVTKA